MGFPVIPFLCPDHLFVAAHNKSCASTGAYRPESYEISGAGQPRRVEGARLTASLFQVLGIQPPRGRTFTQTEDNAARPVAVLDYGFAGSLFGVPGHALGRIIHLDRKPYTVVGIMPPSSFPLRGQEFDNGTAMLPFNVQPYFLKASETDPGFRPEHLISMRVALPDKVEKQPAQINGFFDGLLTRLSTLPACNKPAQYRTCPRNSTSNRILSAEGRLKGVGRVDTIFCMGNALESLRVPLLHGRLLQPAMLGIAGLLAYNTAQRKQEFGVRTALGADRRDLLLLVFQYGLQLSGIGIAVGVLASLLVTRAVSTLLYNTSPYDLCTFVAVPSILTSVTLAASLFPAWRAVHTDPITALREE